MVKKLGLHEPLTQIGLLDYLEQILIQKGTEAYLLFLSH